MHARSERRDVRDACRRRKNVQCNALQCIAHVLHAVDATAMAQRGRAPLARMLLVLNACFAPRLARRAADPLYVVCACGGRDLPV